MVKLSTAFLIYRHPLIPIEFLSWLSLSAKTDSLFFAFGIPIILNDTKFFNLGYL